MIWRDIPLISHAIRRKGPRRFFTGRKIGAAAMVFLLTGYIQAADAKKIIFIAGPPSHGPCEHEHRAGCLLLQSCLEHVPGVTSLVYSNGWPNDAEGALAGAATIVIYSDGGEGHPLLRITDWRPSPESSSREQVLSASITLSSRPKRGAKRNSWTGLAGASKSVGRSILHGQPIIGPCRNIQFPGA